MIEKIEKKGDLFDQIFKKLDEIIDWINNQEDPNLNEAFVMPLKTMTLSEFRKDKQETKETKLQMTKEQAEQLLEDIGYDYIYNLTILHGIKILKEKGYIKE